MSFTFTNYPILTPEQQNPANALISRALEAFTKGTQASYLPRQLEADIQQKQAASQKNMMISQLLQSMAGGNAGGSEEMPQGGSQGISKNLNPAIIKGLLGIDPYLMSPQEAQNLKIQGAIKENAQKQNIKTTTSDIAREYLQNHVSLPQEYMGFLGSVNMTHDRALAEKGDEAAKERLVKAALAEKLVPEYSGFQLESQGQRGTVSALEHQRNAIRQGWPIASKFLSENLPADLQKEVERRHNHVVQKVNKLREKYLGEGERPLAEGTMGSKSMPKKISQSQIAQTALNRGISEDDVIIKLAEKLGISLDDFMNKYYSPE